MGEAWPGRQLGKRFTTQFQLALLLRGLVLKLAPESDCAAVDLGEMGTRLTTHYLASDAGWLQSCHYANAV